MENNYNYLKGLLEKANKLVYEIIKEFIEWEMISEKELVRLQELDYCKDVLGIQNALLVVDIDNNVNSSCYCNEPISSYGKEYYMCKRRYLHSNERYLVWLYKWMDINKRWESVDEDVSKYNHDSFDEFCSMYELDELSYDGDRYLL